MLEHWNWVPWLWFTAQFDQFWQERGKWVVVVLTLCLHWESRSDLRWVRVILQLLSFDFCTGEKPISGVWNWGSRSQTGFWGGKDLRIIETLSIPRNHWSASKSGVKGLGSKGYDSSHSISIFLWVSLQFQSSGRRWLRASRELTTGGFKKLKELEGMQLFLQITIRIAFQSFHYIRI